MDPTISTGTTENIVVTPPEVKASFEVDQENPSLSDGDMKETIKTTNSSEDSDDEQVRTKKFVVVVAAAAALGGLIFGYDIGGAGM